MKPNLQNLERLCSKMQSRYGTQDPMVQQLQAELATRQSQADAACRWTTPQMRFHVARPIADLQRH